MESLFFIIYKFFKWLIISGLYKLAIGKLAVYDPRRKLIQTRIETIFIQFQSQVSSLSLLLEFFLNINGDFEILKIHPWPSLFENRFALWFW